MLFFQSLLKSSITHDYGGSGNITLGSVRIMGVSGSVTSVIVDGTPTTNFSFSDDTMQVSKIFDGLYYIMVLGARM